MLKFNCCLVVFVVFFCVACNDTKSKPLDINFTEDSTMIRIKNIDPVGLHQIKNGDLSDSVVQRMVQVLESPMAGDSSGQELMLMGKIYADSSGLLFRPAEPFERGRRYMVLTFINSKFGDLQSLIQSRTKFSMAPNQKILQR